MKDIDKTNLKRTSFIVALWVSCHKSLVPSFCCALILYTVHYTVHCAPFVVQRTVLRVGCVFHNAAIRENVLEFILFECLTEPPIERSDWYQNFSFFM